VWILLARVSYVNSDPVLFLSSSHCSPPYFSLPPSLPLFLPPISCIPAAQQSYPPGAAADFPPSPPTKIQVLRSHSVFARRGLLAFLLLPDVPFFSYTTCWQPFFPNLLVSKSRPCICHLPYGAYLALGPPLPFVSFRPPCFTGPPCFSRCFPLSFRFFSFACSLFLCC